MIVYNQGVRINYQVEGAGTPLVLHHSFGQRLAVWSDNGCVEALKDAYQLIMIDSRGHGRSDKLFRPDAYSLEARAADVTAVLDELGVGQAHYFGYSLGGWVGFGLAKYAPERLRSLVIGGAQPYGQSMAPYRQMLQAGLKASLAQLERAAGRPLPEQVRHQFLANNAQALLAAYGNDRPDISEILPGMRMPALLFGGEEDSLYPAIERCAVELPNASLISWPGLNHIQLGVQLEVMVSPLRSFLAAVSTLTPNQREINLPNPQNQPLTKPLADGFWKRGW
jgi:pimeloyl-ACP methyl ester carboxylesterase